MALLRLLLGMALLVAAAAQGTPPHSIVVNGVTQSWQTVGGVTQYSFSTADGYLCQTDPNMQWGCLLNGVIVLEIPVAILPISGLVCIPFGAPTPAPTSPAPVTSTPVPSSDVPTETPSTPVPTVPTPPNTPNPSSSEPITPGPSTVFPVPPSSPGLTLPPVSIDGSTAVSVGGVVIGPHSP
ncbi:hypothetical protein KFL_002460115 [Klebsormidium nitens]|uniref:Uncharacterized protein n=1 Tax=Klebsormidium nitens TaxID=105231 RepID=A0A1Y1I3X0_KLENI|nr:hypothetical protein KFL_002460115 [Klebsormidium nitens]|eukprot:GAQ85635.1 hypothetical protein KFL_002460115 [Klebsormidium nitens]